MKRSGSEGFTLIELLIVVGIIAILAAIAIPNMLEAQTRAKVARAKNDLRVIAGALEMYRTDNNAYPTYHYVRNSRSSTGFSFHPGGQVISVGNSPPFNGPNPLVKPIAYLSQFPHDVFGTRLFTDPPEAAEYYYVNWDYALEILGEMPVFEALRMVQGPWRVHSPGPDLSGPDSLAAGIQISYDPTNGTVSIGDVVRSQMQGQVN